MKDTLMTKMQRYVATLREQAAYYIRPPEEVQTAYNMSSAFYTAAEDLARILDGEQDHEIYKSGLIFGECLDCRSVGAPHVLCDGCLHNQRVIAELHSRWAESRRESKEAEAYRKAAEVCREMVVGGRAWNHEQQIAGEALLEAAENIDKLRRELT